MRLSTGTVALEVSRLLNEDSPSQINEYLQGEYRGWYAGFVAQNGRVRANQEAADKIEFLLNPAGSSMVYRNNIAAGFQAKGDESDEMSTTNLDQ